jgi:hypothetical protein
MRPVFIAHIWTGPSQPEPVLPSDGQRNRHLFWQSSRRMPLKPSLPPFCQGFPSSINYVLMPLSRSTFLHSLCNESTTVTHPKMFGLLAVILSLAMVMSKLVRREGIYKSDLILSRIVIFVIGTAVVTALGRYDMEASPDTFRYGTDKLT